ncbi:MAG: hypothetical protein ACJ0DD_09420, partial [Paracoccaceae bacterium]
MGLQDLFLKDSSKSYTATIKDTYGNNATGSFSLNGDASGITVDGGASGVGVDGYIEGNTIYADNDGDGKLSFGDSTASTNQTGVFKLYGATGPLIMEGGTDKATGLDFGVRYEAPAGYTSITPISSVVRSLETKDTQNSGSQATSAAEGKASEVIGLDAAVNLSTFDAYNAVSDSAQITQAIAYQKAAAAVALVVDIGSTGFVELVKQIENADGTVPEAYRIKNQGDNAFTTQKASELMFDAISDAIISGKIGAGFLKTFGSASNSTTDIAAKIVEIITPTAQAVLGDNYSNYESSISNEALVLAAGVERVNNVASGTLTTETAISGLIEIVQTQSVWQGDANQALEDNNPDNDWLNANATLPENVTFTPVTTLGAVLPEGADGYGAKDADGNLTWGGYELKIDGTVVDTSKYTVNWYKVAFNDDGQDTYSSVAEPTSGEINNSSFTTLALQLKVGDDANARLGKGLTFEVVSATDASNKILSKENAPVIRGSDGIIDNSVMSDIFTWGGLADGAAVGVVVPTSYKISSLVEQRDQFEGGTDGTGAEYSFTVTRQGNMSLSQSIDYVVEPSLTLSADDFEGDQIPSGTIVFAPQEDTKTLTVKLKNDSTKEGPESFNVRLKDNLGSAQILEDVVSYSVSDDDPNYPDITGLALDPTTKTSKTPLAISAGSETNITNLDFDYFDQGASFKISTQTLGGTVKFNNKIITPTDTFSFTEIKTALGKISFTGEEGQNSGSVLLTVTDTDTTRTVDPRTATLKYSIQNKPIISHEEDSNANFITGKFGSVAGISISDVDFEDLNNDGEKGPDEERQTLLVTLKSDGGKISLVNPNDEANNSVKVTVGIDEDQKGATILGKSDAINSVLSSLKFNGDPNKVSGSITVTASDQDSLTSDVIREIKILDINPAPPSIQVPSIKINAKAGTESSLPGIIITDIDSGSVVVTISAPNGSFSGIDPLVHQVSGLKSPTLTVTGAVATVNAALENLKYDGVQGSGNIQITVDARDSEGNLASEKGTINVTVVDNEPPKPGGDLTFKQTDSISNDVAVQEDAQNSPITLNIPVANLIDPDSGGVTPTEIRIVEVEGGILKSGGSNIEIGDTSPKIELLEVKENNNIISFKKDFTFTPTADRTETAKIKYVVVDPALDTGNSLPSIASIPLTAVNDAPELRGDTETIRIFNEDDLGLFLDQGVSIKDEKDNGKVLSFATVELSNKQAGDELLFSTDFFKQTIDEANKKIILTSLNSENISEGEASVFGKSISIFQQNIRSVKFVNKTDNPNTSETRVVKIKIKDADPSASNASSELNKESSVLTFNLKVTGKNDDPSF